MTDDQGGRESPEGKRATLRLLVDRDFGTFFWSQLLSTIGIWVHNIAAAIVVFQLTGSALLVGLVSVGQFLPQVILSPWSGAVADRGDRRRQVVAGRLISALGSGSLAAWFLSSPHDSTLGAAIVLAAAVVVGIGYAVGSPALHAVLPALVRPDELPAAVSLNSLPFTLARAAGPALGAFLATGLGPATAFALAAATHVIFAGAFLAVRIRDVARRSDSDGRVRAGIAYVLRDRPTAALLLGVTAIGIAIDPVVTLTPPLAESLSGGGNLVGWLASAFGAGAGLAYLAVGSARERVGLAPSAVFGLLLLGLSMIALGFSPTVVLALIVIGLAGVGMTFALTALTTLIQQRVDEEFRGRVMALWSVAYLGSRPGAAAFNGAVADSISVTAALVVVGLVAVAGAVIVRPSRVLNDPEP